jgi:hypothetical protein
VQGNPELKHHQEDRREQGSEQHEVNRGSAVVAASPRSA